MKVVLALALLLLASPAAAAEDVAAFYRGKTVRIVVGVGVGSGYDINARLLARHMAAHIPGQPTVIVQNQPGAGSLTMTNQLYASGPFDGSVIGAPFNGLPTTPLLQPGGARFDATKLNWIGSSNRETQITYVWHTAPVQNVAELAQKEPAVWFQVQGHHRL
jgi:tripartite-type tricarboxylate transporter receptor subunit TctC